MTKKRNHFLICLLVVLMSILTKPYMVLGDSTNGQVVVPSEISFYEDNSESTKDEPTSSSSIKKNTSKNNTTQTDKTTNKGILPQTGEAIKNYGLIGVAIMIVVVMLFFLRKRRKDDHYDS